MERGQNEPDRLSHIQEGNIIYGDKCSQRHKRGVCSVLLSRATKVSQQIIRCESEK